MVRIVALLLTVLTGFSGLVYEISWQKFLGTLLGSDSEATAVVLGIFLGGLALGYGLFGGVTRRLVDRARGSGGAALLLGVYGLVEAAIGVWALAFPWLFRGVQTLSLAVPATRAELAFVADVGLTALLIGPPTVLMGSTIPMLTQALARDLSDATRFHARVYAYNTAGAFAGALAAGFFLIPWLGLARLVQGMGLVNLAAGVGFVALAAGSRSGSARGMDAGAPGASSPRLWLHGCAALLVGFAMMALQTVLIRVGGLSFGASHFTFSMVVASFVLCIALGSLGVSALREIRPGTLLAVPWLLVLLVTLLYLGVGDAPYWAHRLRVIFRDDDAAFYPYYLSAFGGLLLVLLVPVALSGSMLPLLFDHLRREYGELGAVAGRLYSWNTVGSLLGALLGGYALYFWLDLHEVYRVATLALVGVAALLTLELRGGSRWRLVPLLVLPGLVLAALPPWDPLRLSSGAFRMRAPRPSTGDGPDAFFAATYPNRSILFYEDDPAVSVGVGQENRVRGIITNGKPDTSIPIEYQTAVLSGILPALFADGCARSFVIGFGTGVTAGELAELGCSREVLVSEISRGVIQAAPFFEHGNHRAHVHERVRILEGDAYRTLLRSPGRYDVITSEPSNPWVTGVEMLFSQEFLQAAKRRLRPGGVYAQWMQIYENDAATVALVFATFASVFDEVSVWGSLNSDLLLLGFQRADHALDLERLERRASQPDFAAALRKAEVRSFAGLLAHELLPVGVLHAAPLPDEVHTLFHPTLSHRAVRAFFRGGAGELPSTVHLEAARVGMRHSLLRRFAERRGGSWPESLQEEALAAACQHRTRECLTLLARWKHEAPDSPALARVLQRTLPGLEARVPGATQRIGDLARLFDPHAGAPGRARGSPLQEARQMTRDFETHYTHAAPFERRALAQAWRRCLSASRQAATCRAEFARLEARIGSLDEALSGPGGSTPGG